MAAKQFRAVLEPGPRSLGWVVARVPFDPATVWKQRLRHRIRGTVNDAPFRSSLFPHPSGGFCVLVTRELQRQAGALLGDAASFRIEPDLAPRPAELPEALETLLEGEPGLREFYDSLSESARRELGKWVLGAKSEEARQRRAEQSAERLLAAMEAEETLPPAIALALRRRAKGREGWQKMTPHQRRGELMAVFHYQSPEARAKRIEKLCDLAERHGADAR